MNARVWVNASTAPDCAALEAAVRSGGGELCASEEANAIVWAADDPPAIRQHLTPEVRWVQLSSAGIEDWFAAGVIDSERTWTAAKGVYAGPIAEYVLAMLLAAARRLPEVLRASRWQPSPVAVIAGKTVGVIGAGGIGTAALRLLAPLGVRGLALTRSHRDVPGAIESVGPDDLDKLLRRSDFLLLAAPETPETIGLLDADRLALLPSQAWIVNVGRGSIIDTDALVVALEAGRLSGAALDVTEPEPLPDAHPLWQLPNVIVTSHTACTPSLGRAALADRVGMNVARFSRGEGLLGLVDPGLGY
jgi:phosphoglycerate dehydrogenase-like enzyme